MIPSESSTSLPSPPIVLSSDPAARGARRPAGRPAGRHAGRRVATMVGAVALVLVVLAGCDSPSQTAALTVLNRDRTAHHLHTLASNPQLMAKAQKWAEHLAAVGALSHNPLTTGVTECYRGLAENVGFGTSISEVERAYIADAGVNPPIHRINIEDGKFNGVGIGVASGHGHLYIVQDFITTC